MNNDANIKELARYRLGVEKSSTLAALFVLSLLAGVLLCLSIILFMMLYLDISSPYFLIPVTAPCNLLVTTLYKRLYERMIDTKIAELKSER
ncbi:MAG: hypothetical protein V4490_02910 [Pseudomonadota bacterium]